MTSCLPMRFVRRYPPYLVGLVGSCGRTPSTLFASSPVYRWTSSAQASRILCYSSHFLPSQPSWLIPGYLSNLFFSRVQHLFMAATSQITWADPAFIDEWWNFFLPFHFVHVIPIILCTICKPGIYRCHILENWLTFWVCAAFTTLETIQVGDTTI